MRRFQPAVGLLFVGDSLTFPPSLSGRFAILCPLIRDRSVRNLFRSSLSPAPLPQSSGYFTEVAR